MMEVRKRGLWDLVGVGALVVWLVMMTVLVKRTYFKELTLPLSKSASLGSVDDMETWMAIYHDDERVGYTHSRLITQPGGFMVLERALMILRVGGDVHRISTEASGHLNQDASLRSFVFHLDSGLVRFGAQGRVEDKHLVVQTGFGADVREFSIELSETPFLSIGLWPHLNKRGITPGAHYRLPIFDPSTMAQSWVDVEVIGRETIVVNGTKWDSHKVRSTFMGIELLTWLGPNGERLKEEGLMGLRLVRVTEKQAFSGMRTDPETDIAEEASVDCNIHLERVSELSYLKIALDGVSVKGLDLHGGRQRLSGSVLEIVREREPFSVQSSVAHEKEYTEPYLKPEPMVQSDHPKIKALARGIVTPAKDPETKARRILEWTYRAMDKRPTLSVPNALGALEARAGDCNEHAVLFAALLRAVDIPARLCAGLVYTQGRFYYHAWNEVFLGQWISADALMNQMPADVTHMRFVEGGLHRQVDMLRVIGRLKVDVLEAR
jgi:hypothetical protein